MDKLREKVHQYRMQHGYPEDESELLVFAQHFAEYGKKQLKKTLQVEIEKLDKKNKHLTYSVTPIIAVGACKKEEAYLEVKGLLLRELE